MEGACLKRFPFGFPFESEEKGAPHKRQKRKTHTHTHSKIRLPKIPWVFLRVSLEAVISPTQICWHFTDRNWLPRKHPIPGLSLVSTMSTLFPKKGFGIHHGNPIGFSKDTLKKWVFGPGGTLGWTLGCAI